MDQLAFVGGGALEHFVTLQNDPRAITSLADKEYLAADNTEKALTFYRKALGRLCVHMPAWIGVAEILAESGEKERATSISNHIDKVTQNTAHWRWEWTMLAYALGEHALLSKNLSWYIIRNLGKRKEALILATTLWPEPEEVLLNIGESNSPHLLHFYIESKELEKAKTAWKAVRRNQLVRDVNSLLYVNFLIQENEIENAVEVWNSLYRKDGNLLSNAALQEKIIGAGFGWRLEKAHQSMISANNGGWTLKFQGNENIAFHLLQLVPVLPGATYSLSGMQRAESLTTDQRPFWAFSGYECENFYNKTEMIQENSVWQKFALKVTIPDSCHAIWVSLRRDKSFHFDNKISGGFSVHSLKLEIASGLEYNPGALY